MADLATLQSALIRAHEAGDKNAASMFANEIKRLQAVAYSGSENPAEDNFLKKMAHGANLAARKGLVGIENMFPDSAEGVFNKIYADELNTKEKRLANIQNGESYADVAGGFAKGGEVAAKIGAELLPVLKATKYLNKATQAWNTVGKGLTRVGGNAAASGAVTAALSHDDKLDDGLSAAGASALIDGTLGVTGKIIRGVAPGITAEARSLMDRGVHVPLWKATDSDFIRSFGERAKAFPMVGAAMRNQEANAASEYTAMKAREAMPDFLPSYDANGTLRSWTKNPKSTQVGDNMLDDIKAQNDQVFDEIYRGRTIPMNGSGYDVPSEVGALLNDVRTTKPDIAELVSGRVGGIHDPMVKATTLQSTPQFSPILNQQGKPIANGVNQSGGNAGISADTLKDAITQARGQANDLFRSGQTEAGKYMREYANILESMRLKGLPPEASTMLPMANESWRNMMILENAFSKGGANRAGFVTPKDISNALRATDNSPNKRVFAHNNMPGQRLVNQDQQVLGSVLPDVGPGTAEKMQALMFSAGLPLASMGLLGTDAAALALLTTKTGNKMLMGSTAPQVAATRWLNRNQPALSSVLRSGAGAAVLNQE